MGGFSPQRAGRVQRGKGLSESGFGGLGDWQDWGAGDGFPFARERRWWIGEPGMGSRLHGNDGGGLGSRGWVSRCHGNDGGGLGSRGWVPVCTGTTVVDWGAGDGFPVCTGTTVVDWGAGDGFPLSRERRWWIREPGMGSRLHGNDGGGLGSRGWVPVVTGTTVVGGWFLYAAPTGGRTRGSAPTGAVTGDWVPAPYRVRGRLCAGTTVWGCAAHFHSNRSCRLRPAHQGMKMAPPPPVRVDDSSRGLDGGRFLRSRNPACAGMTDVGVLPLFSYQWGIAELRHVRFAA